MTASGLVGRPFRAEEGDRLGPIGADEELVPAEPLEGHDLPVADGPDRRGQGIGPAGLLAAVAVPQDCPRPAASARDGFRMEPTVLGGAILRLHAVHMTNRRMLVRGRSYGNPSMIE